MDDIALERGSGDVFADMGFAPGAAAGLTVRSTLIAAISDTIRHRELPRRTAARLSGTDQATLLRIPRGRMEGVTIDTLMPWLTALGRP